MKRQFLAEKCINLKQLYTNSIRTQQRFQLYCTMYMNILVERSLDVNKDSWVVAAAMELKALITIQWLMQLCKIGWLWGSFYRSFSSVFRYHQKLVLRYHIQTQCPKTGIMTNIFPNNPITDVTKKQASQIIPFYIVQRLLLFIDAVV